MIENGINRAIELLNRSTRAVAFTGAGISTPSGIPDFRSPGSGVWQKHDPMKVATIYAFRNNPYDFFEWIHPLAKQIFVADPNPAHFALAGLGKHGPLVAVITQNIDMLHQRAGSKNVYEVHGDLNHATCMDCRRESVGNQILAEFVATAKIPRCAFCDGILKPNVTLFGEMPPVEALNSAEYATLTCDLMLVAGSSLEVVPVGDLPRIAKRNGASLIIVNHTPTHLDNIADVVIRGDVADVLPQFAAPFL